jgi:hypothetical protein
LVDRLTFDETRRQLGLETLHLRSGQAIVHTTPALLTLSLQQFI